MSSLITDIFTYLSQNPYFQDILAKYSYYQYRKKCYHLPSSNQHSELAVKTVFFASLLLLFKLSGVRSIMCTFCSKYSDWSVRSIVPTFLIFLETLLFFLHFFKLQ